MNKKVETIFIKKCYSIKKINPYHADILGFKTPSPALIYCKNKSSIRF